MGSLGSKLSMVNEMVLPMKEFVNIVFEITEEINGLSQPRNLTRQPMVVRILLDVLMLDLLQVGQPRTSVLAGLSALTAVCQIVCVGHGDFLRLVSN